MLKKSWQEELADQLHKPIKRNFPKRRVIAHHVQELQKTDVEVYRIEKVIRKTKDKALVQWKGCQDEFNSWASLKDLTNL